MSTSSKRTRETPRITMGRPLAPDAGLAETVHWAIAHACAAPSELNSQPWQFAVRFGPRLPGDPEAVIDLRLDPARRLPAVDPDGREAHVACGAALLNLQLALGGAELGCTVALQPDPDVPDLLARIEIRGRAAERAEDVALRRSIAQRATHRAPFEFIEVTGAQLSHLVAAAAEEGALVAVLDAKELTDFEAASRSAEEQLWADGAFRREAAHWTTSNHGQRTDGAAGSAYGVGDVRAPFGTLLVQAGFPRQEEDEILPLVLAVGSADDTPTAWLRAGAGMQRLLLAACDLGISASFLNAVLHTPGGRGRIARIAGLDHPQVVLRLGFGVREPETPRRSDVVVSSLGS